MPGSTGCAPGWRVRGTGGEVCLLLFRARAPLVVLRAGGSEAAVTRCFSSFALHGQDSTGCAPSWWGGGSGDEVSFFCSGRSGLHWLCSWLVGWRRGNKGVFFCSSRPEQHRCALGWWSGGSGDEVFSSSALQGQGSTGCAPGWRNGGKGDDGGVFFCYSKPGRHWLCS